MEKKKVAVVGAGMIAQTHLDVLKNLPNVDLVAICDVRKAKANTLAKKYNIPNVFDRTEDMIAQHCADYVHVLVPPNLHKNVALPFLEAGWSVFLEKPMAETNEQCEKLLEASQKSGGRLWINHNFAYQPAYRELKKVIESGSLGKIRHAILHWNFPLRQLNSQQFSHWMFQEPVNILLEQLIHPLSQMDDLLDGLLSVQGNNLHRRELAPGKTFLDTWNIAIQGKKATGEIYFSVGTNYRAVGLMVIGDDGVAFADYVGNVYSTQHQTKWPEFYDVYSKSKEWITGIYQCNRRNFWDYIFSTLHFKKRCDPFYLSMQQTISAFYENTFQQNNVLQSTTGAKLVGLCHQLIQQAKLPEIHPPNMNLYSSQNPTKFDAVLIGGTGFIGRKVVEKMVARGKRVLVAARNIRSLSSIFYHENVTIVPADISDANKMDEIVALAPVVIHLAHGGSANSWEEVQEGMIAGTRNIAEACLRHKAEKLIYIGTIASLYLGNCKETITGKTPNDPKVQERGLYSRGKADCEAILLDLQKNQGLPVCIMRPGVVIGEGGLPFHSGIGLFNQDTYCIGWNKGNNPLPLVLVDDVAQAIVLATGNQSCLGKSYNIVGDVRLTAKEYIQELAKAIGRPIVYLPQATCKTQSIEIIKWLVKVIFQRRKVNFPSYRDLKSRGLCANFDCTDLKNDLAWQPEANREKVIEHGIRIYGKE